MRSQDHPRDPDQARDEFFAAFRRTGQLLAMPKIGSPAGRQIVLQAEVLLHAVVLAENPGKSTNVKDAVSNVRGSEMALAMFAAAASQVTDNAALRPALALQIFSQHRGTRFEQKGLEPVLATPEADYWVRMNRAALTEKLTQRLAAG